MRIHALLSFFDEPIPDLINCVRTLAEAGVDHVVAVDGRYAMYPADEAASDPNQHAAIVTACRAVGLACTLHVPVEPFAANEVEKRNRLFAVAHALSDPGDWFWVQDADQFVTKVPDDLKARLASASESVAEITLVDMPAVRANHPSWSPSFPIRTMFRAQPITVGPSHCIYRGEDGSLLWGWVEGVPLAPALDLTADVVVEHHPENRSAERLTAKQRYYADRDASGIERGKCFMCDEQATCMVPTNWRMTALGPTADNAEACERHARRFAYEGRHELVRIGVDPDSVEWSFRNGRAPAAL